MMTTREQIEDSTAPAEIAAHMESLFQPGESTKTCKSVTGEPYITMTCGGVKLEGEPPLVWAKTIEAAKDLFINAFDEYARRRPAGSVLYWRKKPEFHVKRYAGFYMHSELCVDEYFAISARFCISNKPKLEDKEGPK